jgi:hypothetical protein
LWEKVAIFLTIFSVFRQILLFNIDSYDHYHTIHFSMLYFTSIYLSHFVVRPVWKCVLKKVLTYKWTFIVNQGKNDNFVRCMTSSNINNSCYSILNALYSNNSFYKIVTLPNRIFSKGKTSKLWFKRSFVIEIFLELPRTLVPRNPWAKFSLKNRKSFAENHFSIKNSLALVISWFPWKSILHHNRKSFQYFNMNMPCWCHGNVAFSD